MAQKLKGAFKKLGGFNKNKTLGVCFSCLGLLMLVLHVISAWQYFTTVSEVKLDTDTYWLILSASLGAYIPLMSYRIYKTPVQ